MSTPYKRIPIQTVNKIIYKNRTNDVIENLSRSTLIPFSNISIDSDENIKLKSIPILIKENKFKKLINNVVNLTSYINCASHLNSIDANLLCSLNTINKNENNDNNNDDNNNINENIFKKFNNIISEECHSLYFSGKNLNDNENMNDNESNFQEIISNVNESIIEKNRFIKSVKVGGEEGIVDDFRKSQIISEKIKEKEDSILINKIELEKLKKMQNLINQNIKKNNISNSRKSSPISKKQNNEKYIMNKTMKTNNQNYQNKVLGNNKKNFKNDKNQQKNMNNNNYSEIDKKKELLLKLKKKIENIRINSEESLSFQKNDEIQSSQNNSEVNNSEASFRESQLKHLSNQKTIKKKSFDLIDSYLD